MIIGKKDRALITSLKEDRMELLANQSELESRCLSVKNELSSCKEQLLKAQRKIDKLIREKETLATNISKLQKECNRLVAQHDDKKPEIKEVKPAKIVKEKKPRKQELISIDLEGYAKSHNIPYKHLADKLHIPVSTLNYYRKGHPIPEDKAKKFKKILGIK